MQLNTAEPFPLPGPLKQKRAVESFSRDAFGTSDIVQGLRQVEQEYSATPKSVCQFRKSRINPQIPYTVCLLILDNTSLNVSPKLIRGSSPFPDIG